MLLLQIKTFVNENSPFENFSNPHTYLSYKNVYRTFILPLTLFSFLNDFYKLCQWCSASETNQIKHLLVVLHRIISAIHKWILNEFNLSNKQLMKKWFSKMSRFIYVSHSIFVWTNLRLNLYIWIMCMFVFVHYFFLSLCEGGNY